MRSADSYFSYESNKTGRDAVLLRLFLNLFLLCLSMNIWSDTIMYKGYITYYDLAPLQHLFMENDGDIQLGNLYTSGIYYLNVAPTGNVAIGQDIEGLSGTTIENYKWYKVTNDELIESPQLLPVGNNTPLPLHWTPTHYRVIIGSKPLRVWELDPFSLEAKLLSEFSHPDIISFHAAITPDLNKLFLGYPKVQRTLAQLNYNHETGVTTGPVILIPTPERGTTALHSASDGRILIQQDGRYITLLKVFDDASTTITQHLDLRQVFNNGISGVNRSILSHDEKFLFLIALDWINVLSFELTTSGTLELINAWSGFPLAQAMALTPDGEFLVVAHSYFVPGPPAKLSVFRVGKNGALDYLEGKDVTLTDTPYDLAFFPPPQPIPRPASWRVH